MLELASIGSLYDRAIVDTGRQPEFLFFVAFLVTFGFIRTSAHLIRAQVSWWPGNVEVGGTHIHHLVWGILLLLIAGYLGVVIAPPSPWHEIVTVLFGVGTGLTLDEFALWLNLKDVYWSQQGRRSIDAVIVAATVTGMVLVGFTAWVDVATAVEDAVFAFVGAFGVLTILIALVNLAKEKFGVALVGLFVPPVGLVGALRLGQARLAVGALLRRAQEGARAGAIRGAPRRRLPDRPRVSRPPARAEPPAASVSRRQSERLVDQHPDGGGGRDRQQRARGCRPAGRRPGSRRSPPPGGPGPRSCTGAAGCTRSWTCW